MRYSVNMAEDTFFAYSGDECQVRVFDMATKAEVDFKRVLKSKVYDIAIVDDALVALTARATSTTFSAAPVSKWQAVSIRPADASTS